MNVLVTGGLGAIGMWVVRSLLERGLRPVVYDTGEVPPPLQDVEREFLPVRGDLLDGDRLRETVERHRIRRIIHLAALGIADTDPRPPAGVPVNVLGTLNVLEAARRAGVERVVYGSSKAVYGSLRGPYAHPEYRPVPVDHPRRPDTLYGSTKVMGEDLCEHYHRQFGLDFVVTRFGSTFGPGKMRIKRSTQTISRIIENAAQGVATQVPRGGDQKDDLIYNRDVGRGLVLACLAPHPRSRYYHLASGKARTLGDVAAAVKALLPGADISIGPGLDYNQLGKNPYGVLDTAGARDELGFEAQFDLPAAVEDYLRVLRRR